MQPKSIKKNYIYNLILTTLNMIFPLFTAPYLSYVLGAVNIGKVNYANSIVSWFILFSAFGIPRYGIRQVAMKRENKEELSNTFWNLLSIQAILSVVSIIVYLSIILNISKFQEDINLYSMMIIQIILSIFSIDWFFQGIEEYSYITIRNIIFKTISIVLIFLMIKVESDYLIYAFINIFALSFNNMLNYFHAQKYINKKVSEWKIIYYLKDLKVYFFTSLIISLYVRFDQIIVGSISEIDLAFYIRSKTFYGIGISIVNSIITVLIPRMAYLMHNNYTEYKVMINKSINYIYLLGFPCVVGLFLLSDELMILFGGNEFLPASLSLKIICVLIVIQSIGYFQIQQILLPNKCEIASLKLQFIGAIISIILNLILIPIYGFIGASIAWCMTEITLMVLETVFIRFKLREIKIIYFTNSMFKYLLAAMLMGTGVLVIKSFNLNSILTLLISLVFSPVVYFGIIIILRDKFVFEILSQVLKKLNTSYIK